MNKRDVVCRGWRVAKLGDICREDRIAIGRDDSAYAGMPYIGLEHVEASTGNVLVEEDALSSDSRSSNFRFTTEHVLYGKLRPYLNKVALPDFAGRCTTEIIPLKPLSVDRRWLGWFLRWPEVVRHAMLGKTGSRMPRTSMQHLLTLSVHVPPLSEQRRIVARLERQVRAIDRARAAAASQVTAVSAMSSALLRVSFPTGGSRRPRGWYRAKLGDVCSLTVGRTPARANGLYWCGPHSWVTIGDITASDGLVTKTEDTLSDAGAAQCGRRRLLPCGTLLFSFKLSIGATAFAGCDLYTNEAIVGLRPHDESVVDRRYLRLALQTADYRGLVDVAAKGRTLNSRTLRMLDIPIAPIQVQLRIVADWERQTEAVRRAEAMVSAQKIAIEALAAAVLRQGLRQ